VVITRSQVVGGAMAQSNAAQEDVIHPLRQELDLSKYNSGLKLIPEFAGTNWDEFKRKIETQFVIMGIDSYLTIAPRPNISHEVRNDKLASAQIQLRLPQAQYKQISSCQTTCEIWTRLHNTYEQTAESKAANLFVKFIRYQKRPTQSMKEYLDKLLELYHDLRIYDIQLTELALCTKALDGLPESYSQIKTAARASQVTTIPKLTNLLMMSDREDNTKPDQADVKSLNSEARLNRRPRRFNVSSKHCTKCNRSTHNDNECWILHPELRPKAKQYQGNEIPRNNSATINDADDGDDGTSSYIGYHTTISNKASRFQYLLDSGANCSMTNDKTILHDYEQFDSPIPVLSSSGQSSPAYGKGKLDVHCARKVVISDILYVPKLTKTLLATKSFTDLGLKVLIGDETTIQDEYGQTIITAKRRNGLDYIIRDQALEANMAISLEQAHRRFGHASSERLKHTVSANIGIEINDQASYFCDSCAQGKSRRQPFPSERQTQAQREYEMISSDLKGPMLVPSKDGYKYYITFNCLFSKWCWITFLKQKSGDEVLDAMKRFVIDAQSETHLRMKTFLSDNGSEYVNTQMELFMLQKNVKHQRTVPYSPQQNGFAERQNLTIMSMARCVLIESNLPYQYWDFAVRYAVWTLNRLPTKSIHWKTPYELWMKRKPDASYLRPFGCIAYANVDKSLRSSLEPTSVKCTFLGYAHYQKGYVLQQDHDKKIVVRRDVTFDEKSIGRDHQHPGIRQDPDPMAIAYEFEINNIMSIYPQTYAQAMQQADAAQWHQAALDELKSHHDNQTWTLMNLPPGAKPIKGRWIFTKKKDIDGSMKHKARFVAKGFSQRFGIDYEETYSSVLAYASFRILVCIAVNQGWKIHQKDFKTAYLNAPLLTPIYIEQPEGFVNQGKHTNKVCLLNKALYGLKQAGRAWQEALFDQIKTHGYQQSQKEPCMWFKLELKKITIICVYVDDILLSGSDEMEIEQITKILATSFKMKHLGELKEFLGIQATYIKNGIKLSQPTYTMNLINKFKQENSKTADVPMHKTYEPEPDEELSDKYPIRQAIGSLMYLTNTTRPDIAFAVNSISRHVIRPTKSLWHATQKIIKYLNSTSTMGITYTRGTFDIQCWADSDYANDKLDRKSITGWILMIGNNIVSWKSKKQASVALSSTEAEYMAAADAMKEILWIDDLLTELTFRNKHDSAILHQDNQGAIFLQKNNSNKQRTKHIDVRYHFIRQAIQERRAETRYCPTETMIADVLTKALPPPSFKQHRNFIYRINSANASNQGTPHVHHNQVRNEGACQTGRCDT